MEVMRNTIRMRSRVVPKINEISIDSKCRAWSIILSIWNFIEFKLFFYLQDNATKICMPDGRWYRKPEINNSQWTNYTQCFFTERVTVIMELPKIDDRPIIQVYRN